MLDIELWVGTGIGIGLWVTCVRHGWGFGRVRIMGRVGMVVRIHPAFQGMGMARVRLMLGYGCG